VRGQRRIVTDEQLIECFESFIQLGNYYSPLNKRPAFVIEELEINPFAFTDYQMVPLDGMCRFSRPTAPRQMRSAAAIEKLLHPQQIGIIGVSAKRKNFGRIIVENILAEGFSKDQLIIIHEHEDTIDTISCIPALASLSQKLDLLIIAVGATSLPDLVNDIIERNCAAAVMLISGGLGETEESKDRAAQVVARIRHGHQREEGGPLFLGANCMGVISHPGGYDSWFIPEEKLPKDRKAPYHRSALISQSGAFMLNRSHQFPEIRPAYMISMGNQTDLSLGDMLNYFKTSQAVDVIAVYAEGFNELDGLVFCQAVREAVHAGKEVIFYKAGRTAAGKAATSGHTASLAGDYMVCESCVGQAGAVVARTFTEFQELLFMAEVLNKKRIFGNRLAAISGAGFEAVGMADSIESDDYQVQLASLSQATQKRIEDILDDKNLRSLVTITNPLDINPAADDEAHALIAEAVSQDVGVDAVVISLDPLSPVMHTLSDADSIRYSMDRQDSIKNRIITIASQSNKPVIAVVDGGRSFDPLRQALIESSIPVFVVCDRAVAVLSLYIQGRLRAEAIRKRGRTTF
jgi:acyl-CoA synthetase (NDP forming)